MDNEVEVQQWEYLELHLRGSRDRWWLSDGRKGDVEWIELNDGDDPVQSLRGIFNRLGTEGWQLAIKDEFCCIFM